MNTIYCKCLQSIDKESIALHNVMMTMINGVGLIYTTHFHITRFFQISTATVTTVEDMGSEHPPYAQSAIYFSIDTETFNESVDRESLSMDVSKESGGPVTTTRVITNTGWKFGDDFSQTGSDTIKIASDKPELDLILVTGNPECQEAFNVEPAEAMVGRQFSINGMIVDDGDGCQIPYSNSFFINGSKIVTESVGCTPHYQNIDLCDADLEGSVSRFLCERGQPVKQMIC